MNIIHKFSNNFLFARLSLHFGVGMYILHIHAYRIKKHQSLFFIFSALVRSSHDHHRRTYVLYNTFMCLSVYFFLIYTFFLNVYKVWKYLVTQEINKIQILKWKKNSFSLKSSPCFVCFRMLMCVCVCILMENNQKNFYFFWIFVNRWTFYTIINFYWKLGLNAASQSLLN